MAGYTRQSVADIIANAVIKAAPVNAEYNAIRDAFAFSGGHKHDGSSTEGAYVPLIADTDALNKVVIDTANNRIGVFVEVSSAAVEQIRIQDGAIVPVTDNDIDLGASGTKFKNLYVNGIASIGSITLSGGTIDDTVIGGTTPAAGTFTTLDATGNATIGGTLGVTGVTTLGTANITSVDLDSGAIDGTTIGAVTPAAGTFTTLTANTSLTAATADINGGTIDGATIGATSAAPDFTGTVSEWYETLIETINDVSAQIHLKTLRGGANYVVCSPEVANVLEFTSGFRANVTADADKGIIGAQKTGSLSRKFDVIVDPYFPRNKILVGYKGGSYLETGFVYAPYVPLIVTPTIFQPDDFTPRKGVMTRYGKKMVRADFYGTVTCLDMNII